MGPGPAANILRSSTGVGLTWASPFGALTASYAVPLSKAAYDVVQPFNFTAGPSFWRGTSQPLIPKSIQGTPCWLEPAAFPQVFLDIHVHRRGRSCHEEMAE
jgi:hypothetical protein